MKKIIVDYCDRVEIVDGEYQHVKRGIAKGGAMSPAIGNWYLKLIDKLWLKCQEWFIGVIWATCLCLQIVAVNSKKLLN